MRFKKKVNNISPSAIKDDQIDSYIGSQTSKKSKTRFRFDNY